MKWKEYKAAFTSEYYYPQYGIAPIASPNEIEILYETCLRLNAQNVLELGIGAGLFTMTLLLGVRETGGKLTSIDNLELKRCVPSRILHYIKGVEMENLWTPIIEDDMVVAKTWEEPIDLLVIDTSHEYTHTRKELELYSPFVKEDGEILLHDVLHWNHYRDISCAIMDFMIGERKKDRGMPRGLVNGWQYQCYNTYCGIGRLYRAQNDGATGQ